MVGNGGSGVSTTGTRAQAVGQLPKQPSKSWVDMMRGGRETGEGGLLLEPTGEGNEQVTGCQIVFSGVQWGTWACGAPSFRP